MNNPKLLIKNLLFSGQLLVTAFFFFFFFFPDKLGLRFQSISLGSTHDPVFIRVAKMVVWLVVLCNLTLIYYKEFIKVRRSERASGIALSVLTVAKVFIFFEIGFMFFPQTHGVATTKASALWVDKYYKPVNSLNYRDREPNLSSQKKVILFAGDSYTAGYGNKYVSERFSDMVYHRLDTTVYDVYNLGVPGIDTRGAAANLRQYPLKPDIIVLGYFFNDIEVAAADHGYKPDIPPMYSNLSRLLKHVVTRFYFPNFIYWHLPNSSGAILDAFVRKCYGDQEILQAHFDDLADIIRYRDEIEAELIALMIPFLPDPAYSEAFTRPVADFLASQGAKVVHISEEVSKLPVSERVVNSTDSHASVKTNAIIADKLLEVIH